MLLIYNLITGSIGGMINEILVEIFSVIGLFRYDLKKQVDAKAGGNEKA